MERHPLTVLRELDKDIKDSEDKMKLIQSIFPPVVVYDLPDESYEYDDSWEYDES